MSDLIIRSAHIRTMAHDADAHTRPTAAAVVDGRIAWLGTDEDAAAWTGPRHHGHWHS
ncbi:hypothetical protein [Nesterenkonia pannonica]|uniref:hypothetical protein n=1 Tax=Nesterenkonia pannonica TaxID=1548602 RepID=UPI002164BB65|nr:hypothetical protein [Nesterenkonia pannonica]